jgi:predicted nucleic acid-binding protein
MNRTIRARVNRGVLEPFEAINIPDLLIGATALRHDLTLLSNNRRHFEAIQGLRLESS